MKVITAIGNPEINEELNNDSFYEVIGVDIQYQDGIFEILENNKNINYLILNLNIIGDLNETDFIEKIIEENNNLKLIIILEKENKKTINYLLSKNIKNILLKNKNNLIEINNIIKNKLSINYFEKNVSAQSCRGRTFFLSIYSRKKCYPCVGLWNHKNK